MSFPYALPTTGALSFVDYLKDCKEYSSTISDATACRGRLRTVLKDHKKEALETRDYRLIISTIDDYLPYLLGIIGCLEAGELEWQKTIETSWRSTLSDHIIHTGSNAPRMVCSGIYYELLFVLLTYAYAHSLQSNDTIRVAQEQDSPTNASMLYNEAADALNTSASIFHCIANEVIPKWQEPAENMPLETVRDLSVALSKLALADAQSVAIQKALVGSPSKSLIAKLYIGVSEEYEKACGLISSISHSQGVSAELKKHLADGSLFYKSMAKKYLALDDNDNEKLGAALGFLRDCKADLQLVQRASLSKPHLRKSVFAARAYKEEKEIEALLQTYTMVNDTVTYQTVVARQDLQRMIPSGRRVVELKRFGLPPPAFGKTHENGVGGEQAAYARSGSYY